MMKLERRTLLKSLIIVALLSVIIYLSVLVRLSTLSSSLILDYDPWWHFRHAVEILNNNLQVPKWDLLSFYPPGRPAELVNGWEYTMIIFYKIISIFKAIPFMEVAKLSPVIMVALTPIPAFFLGKQLSNNWGGLAVALFATLTPTFIGVSMAGYCDTDVTVVFSFILSTLFIMLSLMKRKIYYYLLAILSNIYFVYSWGAGWLPLILFVVFLPAFFVFRMIEEIVHERKLKFNFGKILNELKPLTLPLLIILVVTNVIGQFFGLGNFILSFVGGLGFTGISSMLLLGVFALIVAFFGFLAGYNFRGKLGGILGAVIALLIVLFVLLTNDISPKPLLVNISVAELQVINIFSRDGISEVAGRIGVDLVSFIFLFSPVGLLIFIGFKMYKKISINYAEVFLLVWSIVTFYLILHGVRFALLFSVSSAVSAGYLIGNLTKYLKKGVIAGTVFGLIFLSILIFVSNAIQIGYSSQGMEVDQNWISALDWLKTNANKNSLITTWWDPGHIITGYTGLKVMADGAHCGIGVCIPYNHNIRIQDMGFVFSTNDEEKAIETLKNYMSLTPQQCDDVKKTFGDAVPKDACKPVSEMYLIASSDLIGKYHWLSYFGQQGNAQDFIQLPMTGYDPNQGTISYYNGAVYLVRKDNQWVPVYQNRNVIDEIVYYENGQQVHLNFTNVTDSYDGLVWVDPSYQTIILMTPQIRDSIFTRLFFWDGQGLNHFKLVYSNSEVKVFKVIF